MRQLRTAPEFIPQLQAQLTDITALRDDATERGWHTEVARHSRVIASIQAQLQRLERVPEQDTTPDSATESRLIECFFSVITRQAIRRGSFTSVKELIAVIGAFTDGWNDHPTISGGVRRCGSGR